MTDEDEFNFRKCRIDRKCLVKYKDSFLINSEIDSEALRTSGDKSEHAILRSLSLNTALDDVADMCDVCNIREKLGRNRRRPHKSTSRKFTKHEAMAIFYLGLIDFIGFCSMSVMAPFFPKEVRFFKCPFRLGANNLLPHHVATYAISALWQVWGIISEL